MAKIIKMCDMSVYIALTAFQMLNPGQVTTVDDCYGETVTMGIESEDLIYPEDQYTIITDTEPRNLVYPEGWYYAKGCFRNKHMSSTGIYHEIKMKTSDGKMWREMAKYCTLYDN